MPKAFLSLVMVLFMLVTASCISRTQQKVTATADLERMELGLKVKSVIINPDQLVSEKRIEKLLLVTRVNKGSLAEQMGVLPGDLLYTIDDHPVTGLKDSYALLHAKKNAASITLGLFRNNKPLALTSNK